MSDEQDTGDYVRTTVRVIIELAPIPVTRTDGKKHKKRYPKVLHRAEFVTAPDEQLTELFARASGATAAQLKQSQEALAKTDDMRQRMHALAIDLKAAGFAGSAKDIERMSEKLVPQSTEDDDEEDDDDDY